MANLSPQISSPAKSSPFADLRSTGTRGGSTERLSVLIVAANASTRWAGEAILPLHIFRGLLKAGHDAWMCVGNETKPELDELLGPDAERVSYIEDAHMHSAFRWISSPHSLSMGSNPLYYPQILATQWRQRGGGRNSSKSSGSTSCTNRRQFPPGCLASSSTFLLRWS